MVKTWKESPSQTAGPYVHIGCTPNFAGIEGVYPEDLGGSMITGKVKGEVFTLSGAVFDSTGTPLKDAMVEIWQPDAQGLFNAAHEERGKADKNFTGWGRCACDMTTGEFSFETIKPGAVPYVDGRMQAPHITFWIVARGINVGLHTRMYFDDEPEANAQDPILSRIEHQSRVPTLMGRKQTDGGYRFDIHLQGDAETIFFDM
ncbi:protocatechuate 3,4-dioxygenase subunit alpha [uncultured Litoreibacter sp.]|uniref:protocatechuate 3,4-dioxygenase subunit alpha n=1 Tax=uncultured Litoreibacter sp. TaxID=1392394 RepID=UPI002618E7A3|nr:protocatechuate 3,4-dioxygenase subunit alpha [uncultured Litoreibacter sp.]